MRMLSRVILLLFIFLTPCFPQAVGGLGLVARIPIYDDPDYANPLPALRELVRQKAKAERNTFYISRIYRYSNKSDYAYVYWKEGRAIILWQPLLTGTGGREYELVLSKRYLRLGKEIVPPERYGQGTNYLLTMEQGREIIRDCERSGVRYVIYKGRRKYR